MCLDRCTRVLKGTGRKVRTGYKYILPVGRSPLMGKETDMEGWNKDNEHYKLDAHYDCSEIYSYPTGFHIWKDKFTAIDVGSDYINSRFSDLWEVEYRKVVAEGTQGVNDDGGCPVVVAREFRLVKKIANAKCDYDEDKLDTWHFRFWDF